MSDGFFDSLKDGIVTPEAGTNDKQMKNNSTEVRFPGNFKITVTGLLGNELINYLEPQQEKKYTEEEYTR